MSSSPGNAYQGDHSIQFRLDLLVNARYRRVLEVVAEKTAWSSPRKKGIAKGVAMCERSGAHFAQVIEVEQRKKEIVILKVTTAIDVGICINPDIVRAQKDFYHWYLVKSCSGKLTGFKNCFTDE